jgi:hypothetical protein
MVTMMTRIFSGGAVRDRAYLEGNSVEKLPEGIGKESFPN